VNIVKRKDLHAHSFSSLLSSRNLDLNACIHTTSPLYKMSRIVNFVQLSVGFLRRKTNDEIFRANFYVFLETRNIFADDAFCCSRRLVRTLLARS